MYLISKTQCYGCNCLSEMSDYVSYDRINRFFLAKKNDKPVDLFNEVKLNIDFIGRTLSIDETVMQT